MDRRLFLKSAGVVGGALGLVKGTKAVEEQEAIEGEVVEERVVGGYKIGSVWNIRVTALGTARVKCRSRDIDVTLVEGDTFNIDIPKAEFIESSDGLEVGFIPYDLTIEGHVKWEMLFTNE